MIGGNVNAVIQIKSATKANRMGEQVSSWTDYKTIKGWMDLSSGDSKYSNYNAKIQESTHIFICDYVPLEVKTEKSRLLYKNEVYDILLIDNPMELNQHLEIYLRYVGGQ